MVAYGLEVPDGMSSFELEVFCFFYIDESDLPVERKELHVRDMEIAEKRKLPHLLTKLEHFWNIVECVWGVASHRHLCAVHLIYLG